MKLEDSVEKLKGVGKARLKQYERLKIKTIYDLLTHFPAYYEDCTERKKVKDLQTEEKACLAVKILKKLAVEKVRNKTICKVLAKDEDGCFVEIVYFNNVYIYKKLIVDGVYIFYGKFSRIGFSARVINPIVLKRLGLIPRYHLTKGLSQNILVKQIKTAFELLELDSKSELPCWLQKKYNLIDFRTTIFNIHFPKNWQQYKIGRRSFVFKELLFWQIGLLKIKKNNVLANPPKLKKTEVESFFESLPFSLTDAQKRAIRDCVLDFKKDVPMNRLIQGDVGSGKTIVAVAVSFLFAREKMQVALMAPTDILARQHYKTFCQYLEKFGIKVGLLVGGLKAKEKRELLEQIANGEKDVVIGTHALFYDKVCFKNLSLIITDEQHRFGVNQRERLLKKGSFAHILVMSATPIPRTLALIIYADLNISIIDELPPGRAPIKTFCIGPKKRERALKFVEKEIEKKHQIYFVCPAIEKSERMVVDVYSYYEYLKKQGFFKYKVGILHGQMSNEEKELVMREFVEKKIDVLIATTVIEVGVDVSNASVIVIENAEMFGLSQLHQLRGRVGRGNLKGYCILVSNSKNEDTKKRMEVMCKSCSGFFIAEKDLTLRGPGDLFKERQHGRLQFKLSNLKRDFRCAVVSKKQAQKILEDDEKLEKEENSYIKRSVELFFSKELPVL